VAERAKRFSPISHADVKAHQMLIGSFAEGFDLNHLIRVLKGKRLLAMQSADRRETLEAAHK
jgi:hypothetical protein